MNTEDAPAKQKLFEAALELVTTGKSEKEITSRQIAAKAGVNLALVNYYYQSKENLLAEVVGTIMGGIIEQTNRTNPAGASAETRLRNMLLATADAAFQYPNICQIALARELKTGCETSCQLVIPLLQEIFPGYQEIDLRILALQLLIPFHHIVLQPEIYNQYLSTDFFDHEKQISTINQMIDCFLTKPSTEANS